MERPELFKNFLAGENTVLSGGHSIPDANSQHEILPPPLAILAVGCHSVLEDAEGLWLSLTSVLVGLLKHLRAWEVFWMFSRVALLLSNGDAPGWGFGKVAQQGLHRPGSCPPCLLPAQVIKGSWSAGL